MKKRLPIGRDDFRKAIENNCYYVDKSLFIKDFIELGDEVSLITRPRRFGKTFNITMLREFFDITKDSKAIFEGLAVMDTQYAAQINSLPVIYFSMKDCRGAAAESLRFHLNTVLLSEYDKYKEVFRNRSNLCGAYIEIFYKQLALLTNTTADFDNLILAMKTLIKTVHDYYQKPVILLIDEYDQPLLSAVEYGYKDELRDFFALFYGSVLKGNDDLGQALLTGIQRVAKESLFSELNNIVVYTVNDTLYASYFGLNESETSALLQYYGLTLDESVKSRYNGYRFGGVDIYNPWSVLNYAHRKELRDYWINTSTNSFIRESILHADERFQRDFETLLEHGEALVDAEMEMSFAELKTNAALWGLLVNSGYATVTDQRDAFYMTVRIPNGEVRSEFQKIVADKIHVQSRDLNKMLLHLTRGELDDFMNVYEELVLSCTSYHDAGENAYHMLFLGMCLSLQGIYKITSNLEAGHGRSDILMQSLSPAKRPHIIIEFKQGNDLSSLKEAALKQIIDQKYYAGLNGKILCVGLAHNKKKCEMVYEMIDHS